MTIRRNTIRHNKEYILSYGDVKICMSGQEILDLVQHGHLPIDKHVFGSFDMPDIADTPTYEDLDTLDLSTDIH